jgi:hypothetical protein
MKKSYVPVYKVRTYMPSVFADKSNFYMYSVKLK